MLTLFEGGGLCFSEGFALEFFYPPNFLFSMGVALFLSFFFVIGTSIIFFWPRLVAYGILVPRPGIKPVPPALEAQSLNHWATREVPDYHFY